MPAFLPGLPVNVPPQMTLPQDLPALASAPAGSGGTGRTGARRPAPLDRWRRCSPPCPDIQLDSKANYVMTGGHRGNHLEPVQRFGRCRHGIGCRVRALPERGSRPGDTATELHQQLPGLPALSQLSPIIQQAASNPGQATQLLMAAAQAFSHNPTAPTESKNVAASVNQFVQEPGSPVPVRARAERRGPA